MIGALIAKSMIRSGFKAMNEHRVDDLLKNWAEDSTFIFPGNLSISGEFKGKKTIEEWFRKFMDRFPKINFSIKNVYVENIFDMIGTNHIAVEWDISETDKDGKEFLNSGITAIYLKTGKAILVRDYISDIETLKKAWGEG